MGPPPDGDTTFDLSWVTAGAGEESPKLISTPSGPQLKDKTCPPPQETLCLSTLSWHHLVRWVFRTGGRYPSGGGGHWHAGKPGKKESITAVLMASYPAEAAGLSPESSRSALTLGLQHSRPCSLGSSDPFVKPSEWLQWHGFLSSSQSPSYPFSLPVWVGPHLSHVTQEKVAPALG